jgi:hypothetical protein
LRDTRRRLALRVTLRLRPLDRTFTPRPEVFSVMDEPVPLGLLRIALRRAPMLYAMLDLALFPVSLEERGRETIVPRSSTG